MRARMCMRAAKALTPPRTHAAAPPAVEWLRCVYRTRTMHATGVLAVKRVRGVPTVFPADSGEVEPNEDLLELLYDCGPLDPSPDEETEAGSSSSSSSGAYFEDFDAVRARVAAEWAALPRVADVISASLRAKVGVVTAAQRERREAAAAAAAAAAPGAGG